MSFYIGNEQVSPEVYAAHLSQFGLTLDPVKSRPKQQTHLVPNLEWPRWAKALKMIAKPQDRGIGDVVARMIGDTNSAAFKMWYLRQFGKACGCAGRQEQWNRQYPLNLERKNTMADRDTKEPTPAPAPPPTK